jgi:hypothetical protein
MTIGFVVHFFDFRNDVRRLILEIAKTHEVVLLVKSEHVEAVKKHPIERATIREINERIPSLKNKVLEQLFYFFRRLPKSRQNFYLMECFKIANIKNQATRSKASARLEWVMKLPKVLNYDTYLNKLSYSSETILDGIDHFVFLTEISDDYLLARCIKEKKRVKVYSYSWDHPFKHTRFSNQVNYLTWSEETKKDIHKLQHVDEDNIQVWGASQFAYIEEALKQQVSVTRSFDFKYIYYVCAIGIEPLVPQEIDIIHQVNKLVKLHAPDIALVVRPYPVLNNWNLYTDLQKEGIILDDNFRTQDLSIGEKAIQEKFEKVKHAELLLHLGTTLGLEACFFDTPSLLIDFGYDKSTEKSLDVKHFIHQGQNDKYLVDACPSQCLSTQQDLIKWLEAAQNGTAKTLQKNKQIACQFVLDTFENLSERIL